MWLKTQRPVLASRDPSDGIPAAVDIPAIVKCRADSRSMVTRAALKTADGESIVTTDTGLRAARKSIRMIRRQHTLGLPRRSR